jgi:hypothetical protein
MFGLLRDVDVWINTRVSDGEEEDKSIVPKSWTTDTFRWLEDRDSSDSSSSSSSDEEEAEERRLQRIHEWQVEVLSGLRTVTQANATTPLLAREDEETRGYPAEARGLRAEQPPARIPSPAPAAAPVHAQVGSAFASMTSNVVWVHSANAAICVTPIPLLPPVSCIHPLLLWRRGAQCMVSQSRLTSM